jgi:hypothetical protein
MTTYTRWCKWCGYTVVTAEPWQVHRDMRRETTHRDDPDVTPCPVVGQPQPACLRTGPAPDFVTGINHVCGR